VSSFRKTPKDFRVISTNIHEQLCSKSIRYRNSNIQQVARNPSQRCTELCAPLRVMMALHRTKKWEDENHRMQNQRQLLAHLVQSTQGIIEK